MRVRGYGELVIVEAATMQSVTRHEGGSPMDSMRFSFSDTIAGYVTGYDTANDTFGLKTTDGREYQVKFALNTFGWIINDLNEPRTWTNQEQMRGLLVPGRYLFVYGIYYPEYGG